MPFDYEAKYGSDALIAMMTTLVAHWKKPAEDVVGLDAGRLLATVKRMLEEWHEAGGGMDYDFQALLATLRACDGSWFTDDQREDISAWLDVVADSETSLQWRGCFGDEAQLRAIVAEGLSTQETLVTVEIGNSGINAVYKSGDYGTGPHDGTLQITARALVLYNSATPHIRMEYQGDLPKSYAELLEALEDDLWEDFEVEVENGEA